MVKNVGAVEDLIFYYLLFVLDLDGSTRFTAKEWPNFWFLQKHVQCSKSKRCGQESNRTPPNKGGHYSLSFWRGYSMGWLIRLCRSLCGCAQFYLRAGIARAHAYQAYAKFWCLNNIIQHDITSRFRTWLNGPTAAHEHEWTWILRPPLCFLAPPNEITHTNKVKYRAPNNHIKMSF